MNQELAYDTVIAGCGVAGLFTALHLPKEQKILMLSKEDLESCNSMLAQGGICVLLDENDYDDYFEDTMRAGHYENRKESVDIMLRSSRQVIDQLIGWGVDFARNPDGTLAYTREGAHSRPRICYHEDITGKEITTHLQQAVKALPNVQIMEYTAMQDILVENGVCKGVLARSRDGAQLTIHAQDVVANAIFEEMKKEGSKHVRLSFENIPEEEIRSHFPNILATCLEEGYDITKEPIPVVPAQHYFMGGVYVDSDSQTTMPHLYAVGETSCNEVHGRNRLASNSLLESMVFGQRAAEHITQTKKGGKA